MTENEYNLADGVRRSDLWIINESPEKFKYRIDHPDEEKSPALLFGSAAHKLVLEPDEFSKEYAVSPAVDRRTKAGKDEWARFCDENEGKIVLSIDDYNTINGMTESLLNCHLAVSMLSGQHEVPFFWTDPDTGEKCKCRADVIQNHDGKYTIVDYKTTASAHTDRFNSELFKYGYHLQAAMYSEGLMHAIGLDYMPDFVFVAQEKKPPYSVNVIFVSDDVMKYGSSVFHKLLERYHECKEMDLWPGYCAEVPNVTQLPGWLEFGGDEE